jgi:hypothetical protein
MCVLACATGSRIWTGQGGDTDVPYAQLDWAAEETYTQTNQ